MGIETWLKCEEILDHECIWPLTYQEMVSDAHVPLGHDFMAGEWRCRRPGCDVVYATEADYTSRKAEHDRRQSVADESDDPINIKITQID